MHFRTAGFLLIELCVSIALVLIFSTLISLWHLKIVESQVSMIQRLRAAIRSASLRDEFYAYNRHKSVRSGFALLEMLIYVQCSLLFTGCVGHLMITTHKEINERLNYSQKVIKLLVAYSAIRKEIQAASQDLKLWKLKDKCGFVYADSQKRDCGWALEKGRLTRSTGTYNKQYQIWARRAISIILMEVESFKCDYHYAKGLLIGIFIKLHIQHKNSKISVEGFIAIKKSEN